MFHSGLRLLTQWNDEQNEASSLQEPTYKVELEELLPRRPPSSKSRKDRYQYYQ